MCKTAALRLQPRLEDKGSLRVTWLHAISLFGSMASAPENSQGPWAAWVDAENARAEGSQRKASSRAVLTAAMQQQQPYVGNILQASSQAPRGALQPPGALPQETRLVIPQVGPSAALDAPASSQEQTATAGNIDPTTFGNVMTWALSQELLWQWRDDAGGWVNMHDDWMPQLTNLKRAGGGTITLRHDWKQGKRTTWYTVDVNAMVQRSHDNCKTRQIRAMAQVLPWPGAPPASSQALPASAGGTSTDWSGWASGGSSSGAWPGASSQGQTLPPPPPPPPAPHTDAWQRTWSGADTTQWQTTATGDGQGDSCGRLPTIRDAVEAWSQARLSGGETAPAATWQSALQPPRRPPEHEESVNL
jgi:hypothetical protein